MTTSTSPEKALSYWKLYRFATRSDVMWNYVAMFLSFVAGSTLPLTTIVFGELIDTFALWQVQRFPGQLITAEDLVSKVGILAFISTYTYMSIFIYTSEKQCHKIRKEYLKAVMRQNIAWFDTVGAGEVATRITSDTLLIQDGIGEKLPLAASLTSTFVAAFAIAFWRSWKMTLVLMTVIPLIAISSGIMNVINGKFQTRIQNLYSKSGTIAEESIAGARTVTSFNAQKKVSKIYDDSLTGARKEGIKKSISSGLGLGSLLLFLYLSYSLAFWYGHILLKNNEITVGNVVNVFFAVMIGAFSLGQIAPDIQAFALGIGAANKIFETIDTVPTIDPYNEDGDKLSKETLKGKIELKNVSFTYPSRPNVPILKNIDLVIEPGTTVALVGQSGSGKSTIVQLIERFYDPLGGVVELDGVDLSKINLNSLRQNIGLVSQEPTLFEGSIYENVAHGLYGSQYQESDEKTKRELVIDACTQANAHDFIMKLTDGYDTQVGERGAMLSGGQKQRVAIARAIIKDPKILLLDEATSALDTQSERIVQEALDRVSQSRTTIAIAHRLSTIKNADKIVCMIKGEIIEQGTHSELVAQRGMYSKLVDAQHLNNDKKDQTNKVQEKQEKPATQSLADVKETSHHDLEAGVGKKRRISGIMYEIMKLNAPELKYSIPALFASIVAGLINPFFAISFAEIVEAFSKRGAELEQETNKWAIVFIIIAVVGFSATFFQNTLFGFASELLTERIRKTTFATILRQDIGFFDNDENATGVLTSNLSTDAQKVQGVSGAIVGTMLQIMTNLVGSIIIALIFGWKLGLVATAALPLLLFTGIMRMKIITYFSEMNKVAYQKSAQQACEAVAAIKTVQSLTREKAVLNAYNETLKKPYADGVKSAFTNTSVYALSQSINFLINALVFWYGGYLLAYEGYSVKQFFTVFTAVIIGSQGAGRIFAYAPDFAKAAEAGHNIIRLLDRKPVIDSQSTKGVKVESVEGYVELQNVTFRYPHRPHITVLKGLNIKVKPGQYCALVGPSGCGKSTTVGLLERFYDPLSGKVLVDGKDISQFKVVGYRNMIGLVSQEPNLFDLTIKENIAFGCDQMPSEEEIFKAAKEANIHEFIMSLPDKYDTLVGGKGSQLSGGQKQRIAIARALIRNPKILLLDEATAALDAESEKVVQAALDKAAHGRTTIAIAHRLSTVQNADIIYVLKDGVVHEQGTHSELFAQNGLYHELAVQQNLGS